MLIRTLVASLAVALPCFGQAAGDRAPLEFGLFLRFDNPPSPRFVQTMKRELAGILPGFELTWVAKGDSEGESRTYTRAVVVRFRGTCTAVGGGPAEEPGGRVSLADSVVAGDRILPYTDIDCDRLQAFLRNGEAPAVGGEARLGRAGGRVLAHEMYHILLQTSQHGSRGIAKAVYTPAALLAHSLRFEEGELERIGSRYKP